MEKRNRPCVAAVKHHPRRRQAADVEAVGAAFELGAKIYREHYIEAKVQQDAADAAVTALLRMLEVKGIASQVLADLPLEDLAAVFEAEGRCMDRVRRQDGAGA